MIEYAEVFVAVVESGGFSATSKQLALTPSAVSKRISRLEKRLNVQLLVRTTRRVELTEAGEHYYKKAKQLIEEFNDLEQSVASYQTQSTGVLRIAASPAFGSTVLVKAIQGFSKLYPEINYELTLSPELIDLVEQRTLLAIREGALMDSQLRARRLLDSHIVVCASPHYLKRNGTPTTLSELLTHKLLILKDNRIKIWLKRSNLNFDRSGTNPRLLVDDLQCIFTALNIGMGIALMPSYLVQDELQSGCIKELDLQLDLPTIPIYGVYPSEQQMAQKTRKFLDYLVDYFEPAPCK